MKVLIILLLLVCCGGTRMASADELYVDDRLLCATDGSIAVLQFSTHYNSDPINWIPIPDNLDKGMGSSGDGTTAGDCLLRNGVTISYAVGGDAGRPYGQCGASPPDYFSLWLDKKRLFTRYDFTYCGSLTMHAVVITPSTVFLCVFTDDASLAGFPDEAHKRPSSCSPFAETNFQAPIDYKKYPPADAPISKVNGLRYARNEQACVAMNSEKGNEAIATDGGTVGDYQYNVTRHIFDFDNDGKNDVVYLVEQRHGGFDGDQYYLPRVDPFANNWPPKDKKPQDIEDALQDAYRVNGEGTLFNTRYVYFNVFRRAGKTYVSGTPNNANNEYTQIIYEGHPRDKLRTVCVFARE